MLIAGSVLQFQIILGPAAKSEKPGGEREELRPCFRRDLSMRKHVLQLASLLSVALALALFAPQRAAADEDDPPSRVARLGFTRGAVSFNPAGTDDWVTAVVNRPVTTGDKLWNDDGAVSELSIGSAVIRLGGKTGFSFLNLTDSITQLRVTEGTLNVRVRNLDTDEVFEVDTPNLAFSVLRPGNYKISVNEAGDTTVVLVRDGQGEVTGGGAAYTVHPGEVGTFAGADELSADVESWDESENDFDDWCADRDRRIDHSISSRYVSTDAIGYEDLDEYGGWRPTPDYGTVWFPHVAIVG
jgi:FecR protein